MRKVAVIFSVIGLILCFPDVRAAQDPAVAISSPIHGSVVKGAIQVTVNFYGSAEITKVELLVNDKTVSIYEPKPPRTWDSFFYQLDTTRLPDGVHKITARATDTKGRMATYTVVIYVLNGKVRDTEPPKVTIRKPKEGEVVSGTVEVGVEATDNVGVAYVMLLINDECEFLTNLPPFVYLWETKDFPNGLHVLLAKAYDISNNVGQSSPVRVIVQNPSGRTALAPSTPVPPERLPAPPRREALPVAVQAETSLPPAVTVAKVPSLEEAPYLAPETGPSVRPELRPSKSRVSEPFFPSTEVSPPAMTVSKVPSLEEGLHLAPETASSARPGLRFPDLRLSEPAVPLARAKEALPKVKPEVEAPERKPVTTVARPSFEGIPRAAATFFSTPAPEGAAPSERPRLIATELSFMTASLEGAPLRVALAKPASGEGPTPPAGVLVPKVRRPSEMASPGLAPPMASETEALIAVAYRPSAAGPIRPIEEPKVVEKTRVKMPSLGRLEEPKLSLSPAPIALARTRLCGEPIETEVAPRLKARLLPVKTSLAEPVAPAEVGPPAFTEEGIKVSMRPLIVIEPASTAELLARIRSRTVTPSRGWVERIVQRVVYTVRKGDTLYSISRRFNVPVKEIAKANRLDLRRPILLGMRLSIPVGERVVVPGRLYIVKPGGTLCRLARKWGLDPLALSEANLLPERAKLKVGQKLVIPPQMEIWLEGERVETKDVPPFVRAGIAFAPFKDLWEHTGGVLFWNRWQKKVRALRPDRIVILQIGNPKAKVNNEEVEMDVPPFIRRGRTIVPLSFVKRAMDVNVEIDTTTGRITITSKP